MPKKTNICPCGSKQNYAICCGKFHKGKLHASTAETLMRSRYSAYVLGETQYIYRTWNDQTCPTLQELRESKTENFTALEIVSTTMGDIDDNEGTVEFIAYFLIGDTPHKHHENSLFQRINSRWVYVRKL